MKSDHLFRISTDFVTVEVRGPRRPKSEVGRGNIDREPTFRVKSSSLPMIVQGGAGDSWELAGSEIDTPGFFEESLYKIRVNSLIPGVMPRVIHRDPLLFQDLDAYEDTDSITGPFSFKQQVGLCTFSIQVDKAVVEITIEVFPTKLDYASDYEMLLQDISSASRALALEYMRSTYRSSAVKDVIEKSAVDWLILLRNEADSLCAAVRFIDSHPQRVLSRAYSYERVEKVRAHDARARLSIRSRTGIGSWIDVPGIGVTRTRIQGTRPIETLDTPEHRWFRFSIVSIGDKLSKMERDLTKNILELLRNGRSVPSRLKAERDELSIILHDIRGLLDLPVFATVGMIPPTGFSSLQLHSSAGYGDAFRSIMVLNQGLDVTSPGDNSHSVSDLHELYEAWCYIEVVRIVLKITKAECDLEDILKVWDSGLRVRIRKGKLSTVTFKQTQGKLEVSYNVTFPGLTGSQTPDIILNFRRHEWPDLIVVLDAKYRVDASHEIRKRFDLPAPPADAINALHRYRDAIVVSKTSNGFGTRPVVKGAALYPLGVEDSAKYQESRLASAMENLGIGAIPFLPNNTVHVEEWIRSLIQMEQVELAQPGPPFSGVMHLNM